MNLKELNSLLSDIDQLQNIKSEKIDTLLEAYPFFSTAHLLFLKKQQLGNSHFGENEIKEQKNIAYIPDRSILYQLFYRPEIIKQKMNSRTKVATIKQSRSFKELAQKAKSIQKKVVFGTSPNESKNQENEMVSETLAKIFFSQKHYKKAIETYKKLSLKYPEKNSYFAAHISEVQEAIESEEENA